MLDPNALIQNYHQYRLSKQELDEDHKKVTDHLEKGWIQPSTSQCNHPLFFVKKKEVTLSMCIDYRALNAKTIIYAYPIPRIDDILELLGGSVIFSKIDLAQGYHQVRIAKAHEHRTAFMTSFRLFEYFILPFGLCNAPATFQRLMHKIL